jgi:hypothetical protein
MNRTGQPVRSLDLTWWDSGRSLAGMALRKNYLTKYPNLRGNLISVV